MADATTSNSLIEIARATWKESLLRTPHADALRTRPLMVFTQWLPVVDDDSAPKEQQLKELRSGLQSCVESALENTASFSQYVEADGEVGVLFTLALNYQGDFSSEQLIGGGSALGGPHGSSIDSILGAPGLDEQAVAESTEQLLCELVTVVVLPDSEEQELSLESIDDASATYDGTAIYVDPEDGMAKSQTWADGEWDTGYLAAERDGYDCDDYETDGEALRNALCELLERASEA